MQLSSKKKAEGILVFRAMFSGLFPVLTIIAYTNLLSPLETLAWSSVAATVFFGILLIWKKEWRQGMSNKKAIPDILLTIFLIALVYHALYFISLKFTSAQNVTILGLLEAVFSFIIIGLITKKEPVSKKHALGALLMLGSAFIILFNKMSAFNIGDILMIAATIIAPIGNIFAKRALHQVSLVYLLFLRSIAATVFFFVASRLFETPSAADVLVGAIPYLLFSGLVFLGLLKIMTMFGFKKTSVTHTISINAVKPVFAIVFAWILLKDAPTAIQISALVPSLVGLYFLTTAKQKKTQYGLGEGEEEEIDNE